MRKLLFSVPSQGKLNGAVRVDGGPLHEGIREALINAVTYCDYMLNGVLRIDRRTDCIVFRNPGLLRIDASRIYAGDFTHARNQTIQKLFRMIGYGDNIGSGFQKILSAWRKLGYPQPELKELHDVKEVWLTLSLTSAENSGENGNVAQNVAQKKRAKKLTEVLALISTDASISQGEIAKRLGVNRRTINRYLDILRQTHKIEWIGSAKNGFWKIEKNIL